MKRILAIVCAVFVLLAFLFSVIMPALAVGQSDVDAARKKTQEAEKAVKAAEERKNTAVKEYEALDRQIEETENEISIIEKQMEQTKKDLEQKEEELKKAEEDYKNHEAIFVKRARAMYESGNLAYIEILFAAQSFSDLLSKMEVVTQLVEYDGKILDNLRDTKKKIADSKTEILKRQEENHAALNNRASTLEENLQKKQAMIEALKKDVEKYKAVFESAERAEAEMIRRNQSALSYSANPIKYTGGKFMWPVPASQRITSYYGNRIHPVYKTKRFHSGIDIGVGYGANILAAADGTVTLSENNGGYGKCIIINHGSGLTSLYGHNSSLLVAKGEKVTKGQIIAKAGSTGVSTGPHLHFEVRVNGATTDPLGYLR